MIKPSWPPENGGHAGSETPPTKRGWIPSLLDSSLWNAIIPESCVKAAVGTDVQPVHLHFRRSVCFPYCYRLESGIR